MVFTNKHNHGCIFNHDLKHLVGRKFYSDKDTCTIHCHEEGDFCFVSLHNNKTGDITIMDVLGGIKRMSGVRNVHVDASNGVAYFENKDKRRSVLVNEKWENVLNTASFTIERTVKGTYGWLYIARNVASWGYRLISPRGKDLFSQDYDEIAIHGNGNYKVRKGNYYGIVSEQGKVLIPTVRQYVDIADYDKNFSGFRFKKDNRYEGTCNALGEQISISQRPMSESEVMASIKSRGGYDDVTAWDNGGTKFFKVRKNYRYGLTDRNGNVIIPTEMEDLGTAGTGYVKFKINGYWGIMNYQGRTIVPTSKGYTYIGNYVSSQRTFPYTMQGYKGEVGADGVERSRISTASNPSASSSSNSYRNETTTQTQTPQKVIIEHREQPRHPVPVQEWVECAACHGSGQCHVCLGSPNNLGRGFTCLTCGGRGICTHCGGRCGQYVTVYR